VKVERKYRYRKDAIAGFFQPLYYGSIAGQLVICNCNIAMGIRMKENLKQKGCHMQILSLFFICGSIAGQPGICNRCEAW
jgi:hypothetical protein